MPTLLRVDASFRTEGSVSRAVAASAEQSWSAEHPDGRVVRRDLGAAPLPADAWAHTLVAGYLPEEDRTPAHREALALSATLADEILGADAVILASPLYNFGVSQYTKVWIDMLITDPRLGPGSTALAGVPALLVVAEGGGYRQGTPRHGWDHATGYLERILRDNFGMDVNTVIADLTMAASNPAMAHLSDLAAEALATAHEDARTHGRTLAVSDAA